MKNLNNYSLAMYEKAVPSSLSFYEKMECAKAAGFDRLEISIDESDYRISRLDWTQSQRKELKDLSSSLSCPITTMCLSAQRKYPMGSHERSIREKSMEILEKAISLSSDLGIEIIQLAGYDVYYEEHDERTEDYFINNLGKAVDMIADTHIRFGFETMETPFMDTVEKAMKYVSLINSEKLGVYPDIGNLSNSASKYGHAVGTDLEKGSGHIFAIHLKETVPGVFRNMRFGANQHTKYEECIRFAKREGVSMFTGEFWFQEGDDYRSEVSHSAEFLRKKLDLYY